jgi:hypothetical protein
LEQPLLSATGCYCPLLERKDEDGGVAQCCSRLKREEEDGRIARYGSRLKREDEDSGVARCGSPHYAEAAKEKSSILETSAKQLQIALILIDFVFGNQF